MAAVTVQPWLSSRLTLAQSSAGHRVGTDAMLLLAALPEPDGGTLADLGAGVGAVGLAALALGRATTAVLVEREPAIAALARRNVASNGLSDRAHVIEADITARAATLSAAGLPPNSIDRVAMNPPYNTPGRHRASPDSLRAAAHDLAPADLDGWLRTAARVLRGDGRLAMIHRPEALPWLLGLVAQRFGAIAVRAVQMKPDEPARRVLLTARLNSKAPAGLLPALVLHDRSGAATPESAALHQGELRLGSG
jgi:tRNA1(Val) A37 N6-methylase TrmN6